MASFDPFAEAQPDPAPSADPFGSASPLPSGWTEHFDESSGKPYYSNTYTGETSWTRPSPPALPSPEIVDTQQNNLDFSLLASETPGAQGVVRAPSKERSVDVTDVHSSAEAESRWPASSPAPPSSLAQLLNGKMHGECLARVSTRTLLMKDWKPCFWVFDQPGVMLVFRDRNDYLDYSANPYLDKALREFTIKKRVLFGPQFSTTPISQKSYGLTSSKMVYHFTVEEARDYGPATIIKFGAPAMSLLEDLRMAINDAIVNAKRAERKSRTAAGGNSLSAGSTRRTSY